jgi:hypothetical protein
MRDAKAEMSHATEFDYLLLMMILPKPWQPFMPLL